MRGRLGQQANESGLDKSDGLLQCAHRRAGPLVQQLNGFDGGMAASFIVSGSYNVGLGFDAGYYATGNDNIYITNQGVAGESQTVRLGTQGTSGVVGSGILTRDRKLREDGEVDDYC